MLDRNRIRHEPEKVREGVAAKAADRALVDRFLELDTEWRAALTEVERLKAERNRVSDDIGRIKKQGGDAGAVIAQMGEIKERIQALDLRTRDLEVQLDDVMLSIPNLPYPEAPIGDEHANIVRRTWGERQALDFDAKPHWDLATALDIIDFERGVKISGSGFIVYKGLGARLERALINFMLDTHTANGYTEVFPPLIVNRASYVGTGQLPKFADEIYTMERDDLHLISTAEVPVTNMYRDEILNAEQLPIKHTAFSSCFRREAGAAGKDTRGLLRVHEFHKVELVKYTTPESSYDELETMTADAELVLQALEMPYRVVELSSQEMSFAAAKCYDLEIWSPGVERWLEVSSCSNCEDFQARRAAMRFRREPGAKPEFVHTLNGSGTALPRLVAAILETYQQPDGSIVVPKAIRTAMGTDRIAAR